MRGFGRFYVRTLSFVFGRLLTLTEVFADDFGSELCQVALD
jgi:hypothetical protein